MRAYNGFPPHVDTQTSIEAASRIFSKTETLRQQVFNHIFVMGTTGSTDEEIELSLDIIGNTVRPRRRELQLSGRIKDSGQMRLTLSGRKAIVWVVDSDAK